MVFSFPFYIKVYLSFRGKLFGGTAPPNNKLYVGTVLPNNTLFGGTVPPISILFGRTPDLCMRTKKRIFIKYYIYENKMAQRWSEFVKDWQWLSEIVSDDQRSLEIFRDC